jgi:PilZ domain
VRVLCRESVTDEWQEMSRLVDVTQFGARLRLKRPIEIGRLLLLTMTMPRQLRCFDHVEDQYRVWSLVRNVKLLDPKTAKGALVEIGVAFVGKHPPESFQNDPSQKYEVARAIDQAGLWRVAEESDQILEEQERRKHTRHNIPIEVLVEPFTVSGEFSPGESSVTENISRHGAVVFTTLELREGSFVRVTSPQHPDSVLAVVRDRTVGADGIARLHLEFVGAEWPLEVGD